MSEFICKFCGKICKNANSLRNHERLCHSNPNRQIPTWLKGNVGRTAWNKGLTAETDDRIRLQTERTIEKYKTGKLTPSFLGKKHTEETRRLMSEKCGGYRKGSGRGKSGWYKGIFCDSSWELAFVVYHKDHNNEISRNKEKFSYIFEGTVHYYFPDFIVNGKLFEIKGYKNKAWPYKLEQFPKDRGLIVLEEDDMIKYLKYVTDKYGKDFINLYE